MAQNCIKSVTRFVDKSVQLLPINKIHFCYFYGRSVQSKDRHSNWLIAFYAKYTLYSFPNGK